MLLCPIAFQSCWCQTFLLDPGIPGVRSMGPDVSPTPCSDLTDVTLADEDINSMQIDDVNMAIRGELAMKVVPSG